MTTKGTIKLSGKSDSGDFTVDMDIESDDFQKIEKLIWLLAKIAAGRK